MEKKQTAVEQLINEMKSLLDQPYVNPKNALNDCINLAYNKLQMEKEQIEEAYNDGAEEIHDNPEYYNETYGGKDEESKD
jgi:hypothetical protein